MALIEMDYSWGGQTIPPIAESNLNNSGGYGAITSYTNDPTYFTVPTNESIGSGSATRTITVLKAGKYHYIVQAANRGADSNPSLTIGGTSIPISFAGASTFTSEGDVTLSANDTCVLSQSSSSNTYVGHLGVTLIKIG